MSYTHVKLAAKITKHEQKDSTAACTFIFDSGKSYTVYTLRVSIVSPPVRNTASITPYECIQKNKIDK
jgi:hypothetical protein